MIHAIVLILTIFSFQSFLYLFNRMNGKEHVETNHIHVGIKPVPYLPHYVPLLPHVGVTMREVLVSSKKKTTVHRNQTLMPC